MELHLRNPGHDGAQFAPVSVRALDSTPVVLTVSRPSTRRRSAATTSAPGLSLTSLATCDQHSRMRMTNALDTVDLLAAALFDTFASRYGQDAATAKASALRVLQYWAAGGGDVPDKARTMARRSLRAFGVPVPSVASSRGGSGVASAAGPDRAPGPAVGLRRAGQPPTGVTPSVWRA